MAHAFRQTEELVAAVVVLGRRVPLEPLGCPTMMGERLSQMRQSMVVPTTRPVGPPETPRVRVAKRVSSGDKPRVEAAANAISRVVVDTVRPR